MFGFFPIVKVHLQLTQCRQLQQSISIYRYSWFLDLVLAEVIKVFSPSVAVSGINNRKFHNYIPYAAFHGLPVRIRRE